MVAPSPCPNLNQLQALLLGQLPPDEAEVLAQHLEQCSHCTAKVPTLRGEDTLLSTMRAAGAMAEAKPSPQVEALAERLGSVPILPGPTPISQEAAVSSGPADQAAELGRILAAPQGPDELGRLGPYRVLQVLGTGGMGVVFRAEDAHLRRPVALKAMRPHLAASAVARERFLREARAAATLKHDHVAQIYHVGEEQGVPFLAMELLEGESLESRLHREGRLPVAEVLRIGREAATGLAAAHARGLVHRDIKPGNLWLETEASAGREPPERPQGAHAPRSPGRVKLLDFGLARLIEDDPHLTEPGLLLGTPAYMAPEQALGEPVDHRSDLFSLGCVLYRLSTGEVPFPGKTTAAVLRALDRGQFRPPTELNPEVPAGLAELIVQLLAHDPAHRPASAVQVVDALQSMEAASREEGIPPSAPAPPARKRPRWPVALAVAVLACLGLALCFAPAVFRTSTDQDETTGPLPPEITNSIGMKLRLIPRGKFLMGSPRTEFGRNTFEREAFDAEEEHEVEVTRPFYLGTHEVTQEQYERVMRANPAHFTAAKGGVPEHPVEQVSYDDAVAFCQKLTEMERPLRRVYRLPTEAEWEYACRGGARSRTVFHYGNSLSPTQANFNGNFPYGEAARGVHREKTTPVGSFEPNAFGLYDMHGNVWEWCADWYEKYDTSVVKDPTGPPAGTRRVLRGGSWFDRGHLCRTAVRPGLLPDVREYNKGFRVALSRTRL